MNQNPRLIHAVGDLFSNTFLTVRTKAGLWMNIFLSGLGGLGLINTSRRISALLSSRFDKVISTENRGIAQRRGSVSSYIRAGSNVRTSQLYSSCADVIIAFEALEALREPKLVRPGTICLVSNMRINNLGGAQGILRYPDLSEITYTLSKLGARVIIIPFEALMEKEKLLKFHVSTVCLAVFGQMIGFTKADLSDKFPELIQNQKNHIALKWATELYNFDVDQYSTQSVA